MAFLGLDRIIPQRQTPIERQMAHLRREIAAVSSSVRHLGGEARSTMAHGAAELSDYFAEHGPVVARQVGRQALRAGNAVRNDPLPAVVGIVSLLLLVRLLNRE